MRQLGLSILIIIGLFVASLANASERSMGLRTITIEEGLPSNCVRSLAQDRFGFLWFGTDNGLCRYDGYGVEVFRNPFTGQDQYVSMLATIDEGVLVGTTQGAYIFNFQTEQFATLSADITGPVSKFAVDGTGDLWVSTFGQGIYCRTHRTKAVSHYSVRQADDNVACVFVDANNQVWALANSRGGGLYHLNKAKNIFEPLAIKADEPLRGMAIAQDPQTQQLIIGTWDDGLVRIGPDGTLTPLLSPHTAGVGLHIHTLALRSQTELLIGCEEGMVSYDLHLGTWRLITGNPATQSYINDRFVYGIACDKEGGVWMGTFYGGACYASPLEERFATFNSTNGLNGSVVGRFVEDSKGRIWVATDDGGLNCLDGKSHKFVDFPGRAQMTAYNIHGLLSEGDDLWVGTYSSGIVRLNTRTGAKTLCQMEGVSGYSCYALFRDSRQRLWAATMDGVCLLDPASDSFKAVKSFGMLTIDIDEDAYGRIWFATQGGGLWRLEGDNWRQYACADADTTSLPSDQVNCIRLNATGDLYVATSGGLCSYDPVADNFHRVMIDSDCQDFSSLFFNQDEMWIASSHGIIHHTPGERLQVFNRHDGLIPSQTPANAGLMASDGCIYFGTPNGFHAFYPHEITVNQTPPPVFITSIDVYDEAVEVGSERLPESLNEDSQLNLFYGDDMLTIHFAALSYVSPGKNQYAYRLQGFDKDWVYIGNEHKATYTNLPAGTYTFLVKATNNDGLWTPDEAQMRIVVHPPFWWSWPAKIFFIVLAAFLIYLFTQMRVRKEKERHTREMQELNDKKEQEVRDARLNFFTTIAHEIRTPVTLIIGPLETLKSEWQRVSAGVKDSESLTHTLDVIDRNAQRLLTLINQLLDFNKVQQKAVQMHFKLTNIGKLMHSVAERFEPTLSQNGATLKVDYPGPDFCAVIDQEAVTKVISNLMTNAAKYTKDYVRLACTQTDADTLKITVQDNGVGISPDEQQKIFNPFYQARDNKPGTGIGLNIVKNLVAAHRGTVEVESEVGRGSTFTVTLPINQTDVEVGEDKPVDYDADETPEAAEPQPSAELATEPSARPTMLVVEDDADMRAFITSHFKGAFRVLTAENGLEGLKQLKSGDVTLIVSDWMMPEMDGATFCKTVRQDPQFSHIPFVMLTAKTDNDSKAEGMNVGADAYIEKPFSLKYLEACIRNLIEMRRLLQSKFSHTPLEPITEIATTPVDNDFLVQMNTIIEENLSNADLSVSYLAEQMGVSRSSLFAKIKGLADVTPNEMIQLIRLKTAARLLSEHKYRVNEVAYMVGFSSPSYFSKCFAKQFGVKPAEFGGQ